MFVWLESGVKGLGRVEGGGCLFDRRKRRQRGWGDLCSVIYNLFFQSAFFVSVW